MSKLIKEENFPFAFDPKACEKCGGGCCIGKSGYIWITPKEIKVLSESLNLETQEFINNYLIKIGYVIV